MAQGVAEHVLDLAEKTGTKLKSYEVVKEHLDVVERETGEKGDIAGIFGAVRSESGLGFEI